jgi:predicted transglutaminase-like cysteine proteinase
LSIKLRRRGFLFLYLCLAFLSCIAIDFDQLQTTIIQKFGMAAMPNFNAWKTMMAASNSLDTANKLKRVNEFFNRRIGWGEDLMLWGASDYWATPMDTLGKGAGDCEDFAIAKYFTLINLGVPVESLRLVYVKIRSDILDHDGVGKAHMVLAYYKTPDSDPLILDNQITDIRPASRRNDLTPIFSFNSEGNYLINAGSSESINRSNLSRWQDLLRRSLQEGFN